MAQRQWWQRPQLRTDAEEHRERKVSWLELFSDLVFVVVISQLAHYLAEHIALEGVLGYGLLFIATWWAWIGGTFYNERFETEDISYRIFTFLQMLPVAAMAIFVHGGLGDTSVGFALSYALDRVLIILLWLRGGWYEPRFRPVSNRYAAGFIVSVLLFISSVFVPARARFVLWGIALFIDLVTPIATLRIQARLPRLSESKLPERFGLFVLIVLGEALVGVIQGLAASPKLTPLLGLTGALGMALVFGLWWVYFDFVARRPPKRGFLPPLAWNYLHLLLVIGIAAISAGVQNLFTLDDPQLGANSSLLLAGAVALALITIGLIELALYRAPDEPTDHRVSVPLKLVAGALALAVGWWNSLGATGLLAALLLLVGIQILYGAYVWFWHPASPEARAVGDEG